MLALNGLGWKSLIFPGQVLRLTLAVARMHAHERRRTVPSAFIVALRSLVATSHEMTFLSSQHE